MSRQFASALDVILHHEGGYVFHPHDPGGETNFGISKRQFPGEDITNLTRERAAEIYREHYWSKIRGDDLTPAVALICFDAAVNQGVSFAIKTMQRAARVSVDGALGPVTLAALNRADQRTIVREVAAFRIHRYMLLDDLDDTFGLGWARRIVDVLDRALRMLP